MILVDTSVWVDFLSGTPGPERDLLRERLVKDEDVLITGVILMEVLQGIRGPAKRSRTRAGLLACGRVEPHFPGTYETAANIFRTARRRGLTVRSGVDCLIASLAIESRVELLSRDRDFGVIARFTELRLVRP